MSALGAAFYAMPRVNAARFSSVVCRRYAGHFTAVGAAFYTTARVNAARFSAVGVGAMRHILPLLVPPFTQRRGKMLPVFSRWCRRYAAILLLLVPPFTLLRG